MHCDQEDMVITSIDETGASYKGAIPLSIPRMGIQGDGAGKIFPHAYKYYEVVSLKAVDMTPEQRDDAAWKKFNIDFREDRGVYLTRYGFDEIRRTQREEIAEVVKRVSKLTVVTWDEQLRAWVPNKEIWQQLCRVVGLDIIIK